MSTLLHRPRLALALVVAALVPIGAGVLLVALSRGSEQPPATGAARLVPADALLYLHLSTDPDRDGVKRGSDLAAKFPSYPALKASLLARAVPAGARLDFERDIRSWLGDDAALAFLNTPTARAGTLLVLGVSDRARARVFLGRFGHPAISVYRGVQIASRTGLSTAFIGRYLVVGPADSVRESVDAVRTRGSSLAAQPRFRRAEAGLPDGRVFDAWASSDGVRRLLAPQGGLLSLAGTLLDNPALAGTAVALTAEDPGARVSVRSELDPALERGHSSPYQPFHPELAGSAPKDAIAYLGVTGLARAAKPLLSLAGGAGLGSVIGQVTQSLGSAGTASLQRDVVSLLSGEVALVVTPRTPLPVLTLIADAGNEARTAQAFAQLQAPLAKLFGTAGTAGGQVPTFRERDVGGAKAFTLEVSPGTSVSYAVFDGKAVISTSLEGIRAARDSGKLTDNDAYRATLGNLPDRLTSVVFLDLNQLLTLAEQTGLNASPGYSRIRGDLSRVRAAGLATGREKDESTAELRLKIP